MSVVGGSIESVTLKGRTFAVTADADVTRKLGGFENSIEPNGGPTSRLIKTRVPSSLSGLAVEVDDSRGDHEFLQELADMPSFFPVAITYVSGAVYNGDMQISGELQFTNQNTACSFDLMGSNKITRQ